MNQNPSSCDNNSLTISSSNHIPKTDSNGNESFTSDCPYSNIEEDDQKPLIVDFNILISDGEFGDTNPFARRDLYRESIYELPEENCLFTSFDEGNAFKKSVRFSEDTVFAERNMESPFWK